MQKHESDGVVISCDFCGEDWDEVKPMIEGHHGSVVCLECLKAALERVRPAPGGFRCTLCLREDLPETLFRWSHDPRPAAANPQSIVCADCIQQAARTFHRDKDVDWLMSQ